MFSILSNFNCKRMGSVVFVMLLLPLSLRYSACCCKVVGVQCCRKEDSCSVALHIWQDATAEHNRGSLILALFK
jgi:hypothetical protein